MSQSNYSALQYPPTPPTSLLSDDDNDEMFTPISGNPAQIVPYTPNRCPQPLQLCQQFTPFPDTPDSPTPENCEQSDMFGPYDLPNPSTSASYDKPLKFR